MGNAFSSRTEVQSSEIQPRTVDTEQVTTTADFHETYPKTEDGLAAAQQLHRELAQSVEAALQQSSHSEDDATPRDAEQHSSVEPSAVDTEQTLTTPNGRETSSDTDNDEAARGQLHQELAQSLGDEPEQTAQTDENAAEGDRLDAELARSLEEELEKMLDAYNDDASTPDDATILGKLLTEHPLAALQQNVAEIVAEQDLYIGLSSGKGFECRHQRFPGALVRVYTIVHQNQTKNQTGPLVFAESVGARGSQWNGTWFGREQVRLLNDGDELLLGIATTAIVFRAADQEAQREEWLESAGEEAKNAGNGLWDKDNEAEMRRFAGEYSVFPRPVASLGTTKLFCATRSHYNRQVSCRIVDLNDFRLKETRRLLEESNASTQEAARVRALFHQSGLRDIGDYYRDLVSRKCRLHAVALEKEMKLLQGIRHPNILFLEKAFKTDDYLYILQEFMTGTSLRSYIKRVGRLPEDEAATILLQVAKGLQYLHGRGIAHGNVRPGNVMLDMATGQPRAVLVNFESAKKSFAIHQDGGRDLSALGAIACALFTKKLPISKTGLVQPRGVDVVQQCTEISAAAKEFVELLLMPSPGLRAVDVVEHPWLRREPFRTGFDAAYARVSTACQRDMLPRPMVTALRGYCTAQPYELRRKSQKPVESHGIGQHRDMLELSHPRGPYPSKSFPDACKEWTAPIARPQKRCVNLVASDSDTSGSESEAEDDRAVKRARSGSAEKKRPTLIQVIEKERAEKAAEETAAKVSKQGGDEAVGNGPKTEMKRQESSGPSAKKPPTEEKSILSDVECSPPPSTQPRKLDTDGPATRVTLVEVIQEQQAERATEKTVAKVLKRGADEAFGEEPEAEVKTLKPPGPSAKKPRVEEGSLLSDVECSPPPPTQPRKLATEGQPTSPTPRKRHPEEEVTPREPSERLAEETVAKAPKRGADEAFDDELEAEVRKWESPGPSAKRPRMEEGSLLANVERSPPPSKQPQRPYTKGPTVSPISRKRQLEEEERKWAVEEATRAAQDGLPEEELEEAQTERRAKRQRTEEQDEPLAGPAAKRQRMEEEEPARPTANEQRASGRRRQASKPIARAFGAGRRD